MELSIKIQEEHEDKAKKVFLKTIDLWKLKCKRLEGISTYSVIDQIEDIKL